MTRRGHLRVAGGGLAIGLIAVLATGAGPRARAQEPAPRTIVITARRFEFSPSQVALKAGETVKLQLRSEDVTHGLFVRPLGLDEDIRPGEPSEVTVTPRTPGTYRAICDHFCGTGHGGMKMTFVVEE